MSRGLLVVAGLLLPAVVQAATLRVPEEYGTIQTAIDASVAGDTVLVGPGTWTGSTRVVDVCGENLPRHAVAFLKPGVSLISVEGPAATVLSGITTEAAPVYTVFLEAAVGEACLVQGFQITGDGQGVVAGCTDVQLELRDCRIEANAGNGVSVADAQVTLVECLVARSADASSVDGGLFAIQGSSITAIETRFEDNATGGVVALGASIFLSNCSFGGHPSSGSVLVVGPTVEIVGCSFEADGRTGYAQHGGAVFVRGAIGRLESCVFYADSVFAGQGGGAYLVDSDFVVTGNTFYGCFAAGTGGALVIAGGRAVVSNNVVVRCSSGALAATSGAVIEPGSGCNLLWDNVENYYGWDDDAMATDIVADPLFCDAPVGDLSLEPGSPAAAQNSPVCGQIGAFPVGCGTVSVTPTTFGRIKAAYRDGGRP